MPAPLQGLLERGIAAAKARGPGWLEEAAERMRGAAGGVKDEGLREAAIAGVEAMRRHHAGLAELGAEGLVALLAAGPDQAFLEWLRDSASHEERLAALDAAMIADGSGRAAWDRRWDAARAFLEDLGEATLPLLSVALRAGLAL